MTRSFAGLVAVLACLLCARASRALEPAGGPPEPATDQEDSAEDAPDASLAEPSWLAAGPDASTAEGLAAAPHGSSGFTLGAFILLLGLGGGAIALRLKQRRALPIAKHDSRLDVLSQSRIGPKAYAVTAHVGGRVMLLGVTDYNVSFLGWLDTDDATPDSDEVAPRAEDRDELPDDYPGSALRASAAAPTPAFASAHHLRRFQEVLRGIAQGNGARSNAGPLLSRGTARGGAGQTPAEVELPGRAAPILRAVPPSPASAASALAEQTSDVIAASSRLAAPSSTAPARPSLEGSALQRPSAEPASLRRKRQRRRAPAAPAPSSPLAPPDPDLEGQVAGLKRPTSA